MTTIPVATQPIEVAFIQRQQAQLHQGEALNRLKCQPQLKWQQRTAEAWDQFVRSNGLAESGRDADQLIAAWQQHRIHQLMELD